jgi:flagellar biosynthetic protein FliQ
VTEQTALDLARQALLVALALGGPGLAAILIVGIIVSVFQAMTQINEMTLSFIPKAIVLGGILVVLGPWMLQTMVSYTVAMLSGLPMVAR